MALSFVVATVAPSAVISYGYQTWLSSLMDAGFNYQFSGVRMATSLTGADSYQKTAIADDAKIQAAWHGKPAMNYLMTSTAYKPIYNSTSGLLTNIQFFGLMSTINATKYPEGRLSLSYVSIKAGMQVRCIRDLNLTRDF